MRLSVEFDGTDRQIELASSSDRATFADLLESALGYAPDDDLVVWVDDVEHRTSDLLAEAQLMEGSTISPHPTAVPQPITGWSLTEINMNGVEPTVVLDATSVSTIGRSPRSTVNINSESASWAHATVQVTHEGLLVRDLESTNGTRLDGVLIDAEGRVIDQDATMRVGTSIVAVHKDLDEPRAPRPGSLHNITSAGTVPFNRPPRPGVPPSPEPVTPPEKKVIHKNAKFNLAMILGPLVFAGVMIMVMGDMRFAMFSALSPVLGIFTWLEQTRRYRRDTKEADEKFKEDLMVFRSDLEAQADRERVQRLYTTPLIDLVARRAALPATTLWQRRSPDADFLVLNAGIGDVPWEPPLDSHSGKRLDDAVKAAVDDAVIADAPIHVDLTDAGVIGIVGPREHTTKLARSLLLQAAVHCGPADLTLGVFHDRGREHEWEWTTWLPHTRNAEGNGTARWYSGDKTSSETMLRRIKDNADAFTTPATLLLIDSDVLLEGRDSPARALLGYGRGARLDRDFVPRRYSGIVLASSTQYLPAICTCVIDLSDPADASLEWPGKRERIPSFTPMGLGVDAAQRAAKELAHFEDPELTVRGAGLPSLIRLNPLLGLEETSADEIMRLWSSSGVSTPVGVGVDGAFTVDLVRDGPHGLVGGTTGSGKSEFLRTMVAGLAARNSPEKLTFILIDFKGGAAFKTCERLPHTIGTVSNLDAQLADRALRALEAEMNYRQRLFAAAGEGVDNLDAYLATRPSTPLPRLLLIVDEFAMLAKEYPDVLSSLVSVAAVGRTLGVHMILATQRPAGVVNDDILANTNLRVALRVQSREDSSSVIGVPDAAAISREQRGRAYVKLGQDDITAVQTALVTGPIESESIQPVTVNGGVAQTRSSISSPIVSGGDEAETDLDVLIDAIVDANTRAGFAPPRPVWPEPLGERVHLSGFPLGEDGPAEADSIEGIGSFDGSELIFALSDDPDHQRQIPAGWDLKEGNLLLAGTPGYGTTTALSSIALTAALHRSPQELELLVIDMGSNDLRPLASLPHCVGYAGTGPGGGERRARLIKYLRGEIDRRRSTSGHHPLQLVLIDGLATLKDEYKDAEGMELLDALYRAYQDGPDVGMHFAAATSRVKVVPSQIGEVTEQKVFFQLADRYDYSYGGLHANEAPAPVPGRAVMTVTKLQTHVATPAGTLEEAVEYISTTVWAGVEGKPEVIGELPAKVAFCDIGVRGTIAEDLWYLPVGVAESDLGPAFLESYEGEHMLVAGPPRSGKSQTLLTIAESARAAECSGPAPVVWAVCSRRSPLAHADLDRVVTDEGDIAALIASLQLQTGRVLLLVDDAERIADADGSLNTLVNTAPANVRIVAAGRGDDLRGLYSHWTKTLRRSRCGIILQPNVDMDSDLLSARIPRRSPVAMMVGRGYACVNGTAHLLQVASPSRNSM